MARSSDERDLKIGRKSRERLGRTGKGGPTEMGTSSYDEAENSQGARVYTNKGHTPPPPWKGDWNCCSCEFLNFARNRVCKHCWNQERPVRNRTSKGDYNDEDDPICGTCGDSMFKKRAVCRTCQTPRVSPYKWPEKTAPAHMIGIKDSVEIRSHDVSTLSTATGSPHSGSGSYDDTRDEFVPTDNEDDNESQREQTQQLTQQHQVPTDTNIPPSQQLLPRYSVYPSQQWQVPTDMNIPPPQQWFPYPVYSSQQMNIPPCQQWFPYSERGIFVSADEYFSPTVAPVSSIFVSSVATSCGDEYFSPTAAHMASGIFVSGMSISTVSVRTAAAVVQSLAHHPFSVMPLEMQVLPQLQQYTLLYDLITPYSNYHVCDEAGSGSNFSRNYTVVLGCEFGVNETKNNPTPLFPTLM